MKYKRSSLQELKLEEKATAIGTLILAIVTTLLAWGTYKLVKEGEKQREDIRRMSSAEFYQKIRTELYTPQFRQLISLLDMNEIIFIPDASNYDSLKSLQIKYPKIFTDSFTLDFANSFPKPYPIFWIDTRYQGNIEAGNRTRRYYSSYEIDDILMNVMDDLGQYYLWNVITDASELHSFSWYIQAAWESKPIKEYVIWLRCNYYDESAHLHGFDSVYTFIRNRYVNRTVNNEIPNNYYNDSAVYLKTFKCSNKVFMWRRPRNPEFQHEGPQL